MHLLTTREGVRARTVHISISKCLLSVTNGLQASTHPDYPLSTAGTTLPLQPELMAWNLWFTFHGSLAASHALHLSASCCQDLGDRVALSGSGGWGPDAGIAQGRESGNLWFLWSPYPWQFYVGASPSWFSLITGTGTVSLRSGEDLP